MKTHGLFSFMGKPKACAGAVRFRLHGLPVVRFTQGDISAGFLIDTGAAECLISGKALSELGLEHTVTDEASTTRGIDNVAHSTDIVRMSFRIDDRDFTHDFAVFDSDGIFRSAMSEHGAKFCGLLGSDFFREHRCVIDYGNLTISIP